MTLVFGDITISVDRYAAGSGQTAEKPFGDGPVEEPRRSMFEDAVANVSTAITHRNRIG